VTVQRRLSNAKPVTGCLATRCCVLAAGRRVDSLGANFPTMAISKSKVVHHYYILPCCLLLLNLINNIISYKAGIITDPLVRTAVVMLLVLFGSTLTAFVVAPALAAIVRWVHQSSRQNAGQLGEVFFFLALGAMVFWLYYRLSLHGTAAIVPPMWRN
jgi:hypothetical protein